MRASESALAVAGCTAVQTRRLPEAASARAGQTPIRQRSQTALKRGRKGGGEKPTGESALISGALMRASAHAGAAQTRLP